MNVTFSPTKWTSLSLSLRSTEIGGFRIFKVNEGSPAAEAGLEVFFDFIVEINGVVMDADQTTFAKAIQNAENQRTKLVVQNIRTHTQATQRLLCPFRSDDTILLGLRCDTNCNEVSRCLCDSQTMGRCGAIGRSGHQLSAQVSEYLRSGTYRDWGKIWFIGKRRGTGALCEMCWTSSDVSYYPLSVTLTILCIFCAGNACAKHLSQLSCRSSWIASQQGGVQTGQGGEDFCTVEDFLLGTTEVMFRDMDELAEVVNLYMGKDLKVYATAWASCWR